MVYYTHYILDNSTWEEYTPIMMIETPTKEDIMERTVTITAPNGSTLKLVWHAADAHNPNPVTLYQNGAYAGVHTAAHAENAIANARAKGMTIAE